MGFMAWIIVIIAGGFLIAFLGIGMLIMVMVCLTIGIPAAFLSGHPVWGLIFIFIDFCIVTVMQSE